MVNGAKNIYIERKGKVHRVPVTFENNDHVMRIIDRIVAPLGRRIDESSPYVDARLPDGSRVNAVIPPISLVGPVLTIRKFSRNPITVEQLIQFGSVTQEAIQFLKACVEVQAEYRDFRRYRFREDDASEHPLRLYSLRTNVSSRSKMLQNCSCARNMSSRWNRAHLISKVAARSPFAIWW